MRQLAALRSAGQVGNEAPNPRRTRQSDCFELSKPDRSEDSEESPHLVSGEVSNEELDMVVVQIKRLVRLASLEFGLNVGRIIIHHFYGGDTEAWRSRGPKEASFRRLAAHPELPLSPGSLYRCVALFELCERLNAAGRWEHLGASHFRAVLGLPPTAQENLLATANAKRWTVKALEEEVFRQKSPDQPRGGRRAEPHVTKSLLAFKRSLEQYRKELNAIERLCQEDAEHGLLVLEEARMSLESLRRELHAASSPCTIGGESS